MKFDKNGMLIQQKINYELKHEELEILTTSFEKSEVTKIKNDSKEIQGVLINAYENLYDQLSTSKEKMRKLETELREGPKNMLRNDSNFENDNKKIREVLIKSFELKEEKLSQTDENIKRLRKELNLESD